MKQSVGKRVGVTVLAWVVGFLIFFPILWTFLTSFKSELDAIAMPPKFLFFHWTLENYAEVQSRSNYLHFAFNSIVLSIGANVVGLLIAVPAAWSMAFAPTKRTKDVLMWMLSTKMMPAVGVLVPIYLLFRDLHLLDSLLGVGLVLMLLNLPILIWMLYTYFKEIPVDILEAARMDGASLLNEILYVLTPMAVPGIASTMLLAIILSWNEAFWTLNLTTSNAAPLTAFIASYSAPGGLLLGEAVGGLDPRDRADPDPRLVLAEAARARPDLRRSQVSRQRENATMGSIQLKSVRKSFGAVNVINGVDLDIKDGEFAVFVGPSGCGKSTLLRLIAGLEDVTSGEVLIDGKDVTNVGPSKRGLAMVFQSYALYPHMSVRGNIAFALKMAGEKADVIEQKVQKAAATLNLTDYLDRKPRQLSGGQRQRVAIGRAIVREPKAFLFDEPLSNLDAALRVQMRVEIGELHNALEDDDDLRHPRPGRGDDHGRQDRRARQGLGRPGRHAARTLQPPERPIRRGLHRLADDEHDQGRARGEARRGDDRHPARTRRRLDHRGRVAGDRAARRASGLRHIRPCRRRRHRPAHSATRGRGAAEARPADFHHPARGEPAQVRQGRQAHQLAATACGPRAC